MLAESFKSSLVNSFDSVIVQMQSGEFVNRFQSRGVKSDPAFCLGSSIENTNSEIF